MPASRDSEMTQAPQSSRAGNSRAVSAPQFDGFRPTRYQTYELPILSIMLRGVP
jgi:hypothetical protein